MAKYKSDFLNVLDQRGFIHQISDPEGLDALAAKERITGYVGYDATATSIHIGNLISVTMLYWLQETGHRPISLMGIRASAMTSAGSSPSRRSIATSRASSRSTATSCAMATARPTPSWSTMPIGCSS
jgi:tyrosyl-tRNA synthetase